MRSREVDRLVLRAAANHLAALAVKSFNRRFHHFSNVPGITRSLDFTLAIKEHLQTAALLLFWDAVAQRNGRRVGPGGEFKSKDSVKAHLGEQTQSLLEVFRRLSRKAHDDVSSDTYRPAGGLNPADAFQIFFAAILPLHCLQHPGRPTLYRQMNVVAEMGTLSRAATMSGVKSRG